MRYDFQFPATCGNCAALSVSLRGHPSLCRSGQFSRDFYLASNPRLRRLFRLAPERHYVLFGEAAGLSPCAWFSPRAYLYNNPDLPSALFSDTPPKGPAIRPLQHYIETGRAEQRLVLRRYPSGLKAGHPRNRPGSPSWCICIITRCGPNLRQGCLLRVLLLTCLSL